MLCGTLCRTPLARRRILLSHRRQWAAPTSTRSAPRNTAQIKTQSRRLPRQVSSVSYQQCSPMETSAMPLSLQPTMVCGHTRFSSRVVSTKNSGGKLCPASRSPSSMLAALVQRLSRPVTPCLPELVQRRVRPSYIGRGFLTDFQLMTSLRPQTSPTTHQMTSGAKSLGR